MNLLLSKAMHQQAAECGQDVPEQQPAFPLPLSEVGITNKTVWVSLPEGTVPFEATMTVDLPAANRGIHMSRMEEAISALHGQGFADLRAYGLQLGNIMIRHQRGIQGRVHLTGKLPVERHTAVSKRISIDTVGIEARIDLQKVNDAITTTQVMIGVEAMHITACPCTQVYNQAAFDLKERSDCPLPTHSQRSMTRLLVESGEKGPTYEELLACLESALHVTRDLLKRPDEAEIVLQAHQAPQFAEDAVRETAKAAAIHFRDVLSKDSRIIIESLSLESIHIHDVRCRLATTFGRIIEQLAANLGG